MESLHKQNASNGTVVQPQTLVKDRKGARTFFTSLCHCPLTLYVYYSFFHQPEASCGMSSRTAAFLLVLWPREEEEPGQGNPSFLGRAGLCPGERLSAWGESCDILPCLTPAWVLFNASVSYNKCPVIQALCRWGHATLLSRVSFSLI